MTLKKNVICTNGSASNAAGKGQIVPFDYMKNGSLENNKKSQFFVPFWTSNVPF